jgi:hypothetical protein
MATREPIPNLPFKLSPAEAEAVIAIFDEYLTARLRAWESDHIGDAVTLDRTRDELKARLVAGDSTIEWCPRCRVVPCPCTS